MCGDSKEVWLLTDHLVVSVFEVFELFPIEHYPPLLPWTLTALAGREREEGGRRRREEREGGEGGRRGREEREGGREGRRREGDGRREKRRGKEKSDAT